MEIVKKLDGYIVYKKRSGRFGVKDSRGKWINGEEKTKVLLAQGLITITESKKVEEPAAEEEAPAAEAASTEETSAEA